MPFLRPVRMVKIGVVGLKDDRDAILSVLQDLHLVQIEPLGKEALAFLQNERASDLQRTIGDLVVRFRGLKAALPASPTGAPRRFESLDELIEAARHVPVDEEVGALKREEDRRLTERKAVSDQIELLERHPYYTQPLEYLGGKHIVSFFGEIDPDRFEALRAQLPEESQLVLGPEGETRLFLVTVPTAEADAVARLAQQHRATLTVAPRLSGPPRELLPKLKEERAALDRRLEEIRARLSAISAQWYPTILSIDEALTIENRKLEAYSRMGAGQRTFALEGWIPKRDRPRLEAALQAVTDGRAHFYDLPTDEEPPTFMENPAGVRRYEFFIRFYSLPQATEWDPTWVFAVVFPIFFGLMLGDWGYALVILGFSLWMIAGFPGRRRVPGFLKNFLKRILSPNAMRDLAYALVPGCLVGLVSGVAFNEFFGFHVLPTPYLDPISTVGVTTLLLLAGYIGLAMVSFGFFLGAVKEYFHGRYAGAVSKAGGIALAIGISTYGLGVLHAHAIVPPLSPLIDLAIALLVGGAGAYIVGATVQHGKDGLQESILGMIEVVSHILSYTRLVGILLASAVLALVAKQIAEGSAFIGSGALGPAIAGGLIIFVVAMFNIVLGVFEPGIQGARLIFVENFSKYYTGNGRPFRPFGSKRTHTLPPHGPASSTPGPAPPPSTGAPAP